MPPRCKAPKCATVANKCACPNPWIEFLSKNAANGGKATMKEHSAAYKAAKASGAFVPKPGMDNGSCKVDAVKLCAWKVKRAAGHKDLVTKEHVKAFARNTVVKKVRREIFRLRPAALTAQEIKTELEKTVYDHYKPMKPGATVAEMIKHVQDRLKLGERGIKLNKVIGYGSTAIVYSGKYSHRAVIFGQVHP